MDDVGFDPESEEDDDEQRSVRVVKSGTDFREFSLLRIEVEEGSDKKYIKEMSGITEENHIIIPTISNLSLSIW